MFSPTRDSLTRLVLSREETQVTYPPITSGGAWIITTNAIMCSLATMWTAMRVYARCKKRIFPFGVEDILCYFALVIASQHNS